MQYNKINLLSLAICSLVAALCSEAQCMNPPEYNKRPREGGSDDAISNGATQSKKPRLSPGASFSCELSPVQFKHIRKTYEEAEKTQIAKLKAEEEKQKNACMTLWYTINPGKSLENDKYKEGIKYAFNVDGEDELGNDERLTKAVESLKEAADGGNEKAAYCLAIFYAMGWGCSNELYNQIKKGYIKCLEKNINSYPKANNLFEVYKKTPAYFKKKLVKEHENHAQQFYNLIRSPKNEEQNFEAGVCKAFGWDTERDMERAVEHLLCAPEKYIDDAYTILYLIRINAGLTIPEHALQNTIETQLLKDPRNYSLAKGKFDHIDIIKDYLTLLEIKPNYDKIEKEKEIIESELREIKEIRFCLTRPPNKNSFEKLSYATQQNAEMEIGDNSQPPIVNTTQENSVINIDVNPITKNNQQANEKSFPESQPVGNYHQHNTPQLGSSVSFQVQGNQPGKKKVLSSPTEQFPPPKQPPRSHSRHPNNIKEAVDTPDQMMVKVSNDFLDFNKKNYPGGIIEKTKGLIDEFSSEYGKGKTSTLDISGLSCRTRIYLLMQIMGQKRKRLPEQIPVTLADFNVICTKEDSFQKEYWFSKWNKDAENPSCHHYEIQDKIPTTFLVGEHKYTLKLLYKRLQPGNGVILGIDALSPKKHMSYKDICKKIDKIGVSIGNIFQKILKQKKDGYPIEMDNPVKGKLLNGYSLLLDFEIARRKVEGDKHKDLPLITCFPFLMKQLAETSKLSFSGFYTDTFSKLFEGEKRREGVGEIIEKVKDIIPTTVEEMRELLNDFHQSDEVSLSVSPLGSQSQSFLSQS